MKKVLIAATVLLMCCGALAQRRTRTVTPEPKRTYPSTYSFASNTLHEVVISPSQVSIETYKDTKNRTDINIYAAYNHHFQDNLQLGGEGGILTYPDRNGSNKTLIAATGVGTYNFDSNLREAFFVQGGIGLYPSYDKKDFEYDSKLSFFAGAGKRFEMWGKINFMPYARLWKRGDENTRIEIQALNFSLFY